MSDIVNHIWIGQFGPNAPEHYFENRRDDDGEWSCPFAMDQGETSYDYDLAEVSYMPEMRPVRDFLTGHSWADSYTDRVVTMAGDLSIDRINVFVLASTDEFPNPRSIETDDFRLCYLGEFDCGE